MSFKAGPSVDTSIEPSSSLLKDERQQVIEWIHKNTFPSMELHLQIWSKFKHSLERDSDEIDRRLHRELNNFINSPNRSIANVVMISQLFFIFIRDTNKVTPGIMELNDEYNKHGYYYHYFGWTNTNFDPVAAKLNTAGVYNNYYKTESELTLLKQTNTRLSLSQETFEHELPLLNNESGSLSVLTMDNLGYKYKSLTINRYTKWTKRSLDLAIAKSEFDINSSIPTSLICPIFVLKPYGFAPTETTEYVSPEWQELANICAKPDSVSKDYLAFIASRMGVRKSLPKDLSSMNNDQICSMLLNYVKVLQRGKKPV